MKRSATSDSLRGQDLLSSFLMTRKKTSELCEPLERDDYMVQATPDTSPPKWHLGHTTWFFEKFILRPYLAGYRVFDEVFDKIFNSYYETVGNHIPKPLRSILSRPSLETVMQYRGYVESSLASLLETGSENDEIVKRTLLGINHEQQHQELLLMDIKRNFYESPYRPAYINGKKPLSVAVEQRFVEFKERISTVGFTGKGFCFDNETPPHREIVPAFSLSVRPVTNGDFIKFIEDNGYGRPELWLSMGWDWIRANNIDMPLYWERDGDIYRYFTLYGMQDLDPGEPVMHISYYEADAYARWCSARLPTEPQWEVAMNSSEADDDSNFLETGNYTPILDGSTGGISGRGNAWEWTMSAYLPYPGYKPIEGSLGEYNGKFMSGQMVLKGSCFATPREHSRISYRNFYHPWDRWQFSGVRLARDVADGN